MAFPISFYRVVPISSSAAVLRIGKTLGKPTDIQILCGYGKYMYLLRLVELPRTNSFTCTNALTCTNTNTAIGDQ